MDSVATRPCRILYQDVHGCFIPATPVVQCGTDRHRTFDAGVDVGLCGVQVSPIQA